MTSAIKNDARDLYQSACRILRSGESRTRRNERLAGIAETHPVIVAAARRSMEKPIAQSRETRIAELRTKRAALGTSPFTELFIDGSLMCVGDILMYSKDPSTWLTIESLDDDIARYGAVHFWALDANGKRVRKGASITRRMPVRRSISPVPADSLVSADRVLKIAKVCHV